MQGLEKEYPEQATRSVLLRPLHIETVAGVAAPLLVLAGAVGLVMLGGAAVVVWNVLVGLRNDIRKAWANVDVILQQRHDEVGNLVAALS